MNDWLTGAFSSFTHKLSLVSDGLSFADFKYIGSGLCDLQNDFTTDMHPLL